MLSDSRCNNRKEYTATESIGLLDFLLQNVTGKSRNNIKSLLAHREVTVDGVVATRFDYNLSTGQIVCINSYATRADKQQNEPDIIYEDNDLIVINKPSGLVTVATDNEKEKTVYRLLTDYVKRQNAENRIFIVHRLDRETSGVLLSAKNEKMKIVLQDNWSSLVTDRGYTAIVEGRLKNKIGSVKSWLRQTKTMMMYSSNIEGDGLEAITNYRVIKENKHYSMLDIHLETGRKNQIRVHMKDIGHNVAGDKKYGAKTNPIKRMCLHAHKLKIIHPFSKKPMSFEAPIPDCFHKIF